MKYKKVKYVNKPYEWITPRRRAIFILHTAGFTHDEIKELFSSNISRVAITKHIKEAYREIEDHPFASYNLPRR